MMTAAAFLASLLASEPVPARVAIVAAHYDDETLGVGGCLGLFPDLTIIHVTDSGHPEPHQWKRVGVDSQAAYAARRHAEYTAALQAGGWKPTTIDYDVPDQGATSALGAIITRLTADLDGVGVVLTHAYEGGHPDHDAIAGAVQIACQTLAASGRQAPARVEFAGYHLEQGKRVVGQFWPDASVPAPVTVPIRWTAFARKHAALDAFVTQRSVVRWFPVGWEQYRAAPLYNFTAAPPPQDCLYDRYGWPLSSSAWRTMSAPYLAVAS